MTRPNFLVVGGARCGSTALCTFLGRHPDVFVTPVKEPTFFVFDGRPPAFTGPGDDGLNRMVCTDWDDYEALFADAGDCAAVGEGSVFYLHRPEVLPRIDHDLPGVKTIAILRDPVERAFSAFSQMVREGREPETDFLRAVEQEDERQAAGWEWIWEYTGGSRYADRVERLLDVFGRDRVLLLRYDEFEADQDRVLASTFDYLGVDPHVDVGAAERINASGRPRSRRLQAFLTKPSRLKDRLRPIVPDTLWQTTYWKLQNRNLATMNLDPRHRAKLVGRFTDDVRRLEGLTGWDLAAWRR